MNRKSLHFKLGLFALLALGLVAFGGLWFGLAGGRAGGVRYHSYFDRSVEGLDVGAAVKFRGVTAGTVEDVRVAPDTRHVDVTMRLDTELASRLPLDAPGSPVRARAVMTGVAGVKLIDLDLVNPERVHPPALSFKTDPHTIAVAPSILDTAQATLSQLGDRLPQLIDGLTTAVNGVNELIAEVHDRRVVEGVADAVSDARTAVGHFKAISEQLDQARLPATLNHALVGLDGAASKVNGVLDQVQADDGVLTSVQRAAQQLGSAGQSTTSSAARLELTLREIDEAARSINELARELEAQPDLLLKGRAKAKEP